MEKNPTKLPIDKNKIPLFFTRYKEFIEVIKNKIYDEIKTGFTLILKEILYLKVLSTIA